MPFKTADACEGGRDVKLETHFSELDMDSNAENLRSACGEETYQDLLCYARSLVQSAEAAEDILPRADVVGLTGTSLINHTFPRLMELCRGKFVVMVGPTSPLSPVLFDYGVDVISGIKVAQPETMVACITEGAMFKQIEGLKYLSMKK